MLTAIVGINWGDEGKGRMVDLLSENYSVVCRYQGGNNAGHTVVNERGRFVLNLLPSGILRPDTVNVMGPGMVIDFEHLTGEVGRLRAAGVSVTPDNLRISDRAVICMPYHKLLDELEEDRLGDARFGSTRRGIGPVYGDKYLKKTLRVGDLYNLRDVERRLPDLIGWKNLTIHGGYGHAPYTPEEALAWLRAYALPFVPFICDTTRYLTEAAKAGKNILFEAQLGALRDVDYGIIPYTSSSCCLSSYAPIGAGIPGQKLDRTIGIMKAYSTCVGEGPLTAEMHGPEADRLREAGVEYGAATGRPRRVGGFDVPASRYGILVQGADEIALTKLDVLSYLDRIPVCVRYRIRGEETDRFPMGVDLSEAEPVCEYLPGWQCDISACRSFDELPAAARDYVAYIERATGCRIRYISVGADRDAYILR
ncbi:MAG: adenylosuccinate synthase [Clostridia bacterium]|nr:adenylosuccinate synthase [Clostridia bacterium]